ncbi:hypothetical protein J2T57_001261 [Natronocella acetinitrilica]|uniref:Uncharacterized protein n=1 Tax=Natronocella acetinitrilica TaxID=414046 RepID=A0AAE3G337_9GAMM|nr:hypothetical protein [Natronocella acetinitrilica]MCP1674159.1 hypothetical protein [Natronocella acetinitrilica]
MRSLLFASLAFALTVAVALAPASTALAGPSGNCMSGAPSSGLEIDGQSTNDWARDGIRGESLSGTLSACIAMLGFRGPSAILGDCGCREAIREECRFRVSSRGLLEAQPSACLPFHPRLR